MISLKEAAAAFNKADFSNVEGTFSFTGQLLPFNDSTRSGPTTRRRVLEVSPDITVPDTIVMQETAEVFLVAKSSPDFFNDYVVRNKYPILPAEAEYTIATASGILNSLPGIVKWGSLDYIRREVLTETSDHLDGFSVVLPSDVSVSSGDYLVRDGSYFRSSANSHIDELGFTVVELVEIPDALQTIQVTTKESYDPITETYTSSTEDVLCLVEPREKAFNKTKLDSVKTEFGDITISTLHSSMAGDMFGNFKVLHSNTRQDGVNVLHCRRI